MLRIFLRPLWLRMARKTVCRVCCRIGTAQKILVESQNLCEGWLRYRTTSWCAYCRLRDLGSALGPYWTNYNVVGFLWSSHIIHVLLISFFISLFVYNYCNTIAFFLFWLHLPVVLSELFINIFTIHAEKQCQCHECHTMLISSYLSPPAALYLLLSPQKDRYHLPHQNKGLLWIVAPPAQVPNEVDATVESSCTKLRADITSSRSICMIIGRHCSNSFIRNDLDRFWSLHANSHPKSSPHGKEGQH